jgi:hypothetical protein
MERVFDARQRYFADNGFSEASYNDPWVKLKLGPIPIWFPNTISRRRAVPLHDLHHIATGYATTWTGEAEISAWELAAGCERYTAARVLDFGAFTWGLAIAPRRVYRAFMHGRRSTSLYHSGWRNDLLDLTVPDLRSRLHVDDKRPTTWRDRLAFAGWVAAAAVPIVAAAVLVLAR